VRLVILDADGTLTPLRAGACGKFEARLLPGVTEACARLREQGVILAIASNQSARRSRAEIVAQLRWTQIMIGAAVVRWAASRRRCKPRPAMLLELMRRFDCDADEVVFVGDWETDRQAAEAAGVCFAWADEFFGGGVHEL
jgi:HAD superfamily hydrolase (TIGR01662 family)